MYKQNICTDKINVQTNQVYKQNNCRNKINVETK